MHFYLVVNQLFACLKGLRAENTGSHTMFPMV